MGNWQQREQKKYSLHEKRFKRFIDPTFEKTLKREKAKRKKGRK